ncbi:MetQ/NlpA family ABC transporter substrate-binding protein [Geochorda subterranea]|uniref:Lipoprotein n=1 Tax=Geochorda subterranea TaxID=3109564 RepID=A0ABZ1BRE5_9FIRM|nr:MetQ/NlpA family ABC transporter substrate-binding protein [Limnochorda sp. LNt]WRP15195.1 MetQ/NlpA family ABC transporter substrate-binding protein [Limnochorda sp. LNt]
MYQDKLVSAGPARRWALGLGAVLLLAVGLGSVVTDVRAAGATVVRVGATPVPHAEVLEFIKPMLAQEGIELRIIEFTDYVRPNLALADGELEANYFQHIPYLETFSKDHRLDLTYIARVHIEPMGLYSQRVRNVEDLRQGAVVAIPNDPTNAGRALQLLQQAGLVELEPGLGLSATVLDIVRNPKGLVIRELEAAQLPRVLRDVDAAVINGNYALEAGLRPIPDAIVLEDVQQPYVSPLANVLAVRTRDKDDPVLQKVAQALTSQEVRQFLLERYKGAVLPAF